MSKSFLAFFITIGVFILSLIIDIISDVITGIGVLGILIKSIMILSVISSFLIYKIWLRSFFK